MTKGIQEEEQLTALIELWKETRATIGRFDQAIVNCTLKNFAIAIAFPFPLAGVLKYAGITLSWWGLVCLVCFVVVFVFLPIWWASFINAHRYQKLMKAAVKSGEFLETKIAECLPCLSLSSGQNMLITTMIEGNGDTAYNQDKQERNLIETHVCYLIGCVALSLSILLLYLPRIICC